MERENLLGREGSLYLRQHEDNPVHWRPWGEEALKEAARHNKPILLSIGYSACHWCHVMAHECFEDEEVAALMNAHFVNIKVDREERGDIDQIYMAALTAMGEQGGWPLTMFLTPEAKPFWGGTYFPKHSKYGRPGFMDVLSAVSRAWMNDREKLINASASLHDHVEKSLSPEGGTENTEPVVLLKSFAERLNGMSDDEHGGLKGAPKFPNAPFLYVQWMDWLENGNSNSRANVLRTWHMLLHGGIYDHVGGGMARYSTDALWLVPHFEKMLYDNAYLIDFLTHCHTATGEEFYKTRLEETVDWLIRDMTAEAGGFAASLDADSEGGEGSYYTWSTKQVEDALGPDVGEFETYFSLISPGNWEGDPILVRTPGSPDDDTLARMREALRTLRERRPSPGRDDKVIVDWNGVAIAAIARASRMLRRDDWLQAAANAYDAIRAHGTSGRLPHVILPNGKQQTGLSSDHAAMIRAALSLHSATGHHRYLEDAKHFENALRAHHLDESGKGYYLQAADQDDVPMRIRGDADEAVLSATAQIILALSELAAVTSDEKLQEHVEIVAQEALRRSHTQAYGRAGIIFAAYMAQIQYRLLTPAHDRKMGEAAASLPDIRRIDVALAAGQRAYAGGNRLEIQDGTALLCQPMRCLAPIHGTRELEHQLKEIGRIN